MYRIKDYNGLFFSSWLSVISTLIFIFAIATPLFTQPLNNVRIMFIDISDGSVGSKADDSVMVAKSIADMEKTEKFTVELRKMPLKRTIGGKTYYDIRFSNGEHVAALLNLDSVQRLEADKTVRLPVGKWVKWESFSKNSNAYSEQMSYTDSTHYIDMVGDFKSIPTAKTTRGLIADNLYLPLNILFFLLIRRYGVKKGWFEPVLFKKKFMKTANSTIPIDDSERWFLATYAMWSEYVGDARFMCGLQKKPKNQKNIRNILKRDWGITDKQSGIDMINELKNSYCYGNDDRDLLAWDLCRAMQLSGCLFFCNYIDRETMRAVSCDVGRQIQQKFSSWEDLCENYLEGFSLWRTHNFENSRDEITERIQIYEDLRDREDSPYSVYFGTILTEVFYDKNGE